MFHINVHIIISLSLFIVYASHTQYNVRTDVRFLWTLCSCPQVDREVSLVQTLSSCQLIESTPLSGGAYDSSFGIYICMFWGTTESCSVYVFIMSVEARRYVVWVRWSHSMLLIVHIILMAERRMYIRYLYFDTKLCFSHIFMHKVGRRSLNKQDE